MSWIQVALGLIREAVGTDAGKEVADSIRGTVQAPTPQTAVHIDALLAEHRVQIDRNLEMMVRMLNAQNEKLSKAIRHQRIWNFALAVSLAIAILVALLR